MKSLIILASAAVISGVFLFGHVNTPKSAEFGLLNTTPDSATGIKTLAVLAIGGFLGLEFRPATASAETPKFFAENRPRPDRHKDGSGSPVKFGYVMQ